MANVFESWLLLVITAVIAFIVVALVKRELAAARRIRNQRFTADKTDPAS